MVAARSRINGFTLIELLISVTILGLAIGLAAFGFSIFSRGWARSHDGFQEASGQLQRVALVASALEDAIPWAVRDAAGKPGFYFLGRAEGLTLVTGSPVFSSGWPAVIRLFREPDGPGRWRLMYEEAPLKVVTLRESGQELPFAYRLVVVDGLSDIRFRYFGWESLESRGAQGVDARAKPVWSSEYDGAKRVQHPQRIGLTLGNDEAVFVVPDRSVVALSRVRGSE